MALDARALKDCVHVSAHRRPPSLGERPRDSGAPVTHAMAGHVAAMRALRRGEHPLGFDPFGENAESDEEEDNDDDIEEAGELNSDDEALASQGVRSDAPKPVGSDPAKDAEPPTAKAPPLSSPPPERTRCWQALSSATSPANSCRSSLPSAEASYRRSTSATTASSARSPSSLSAAGSSATSRKPERSLSKRPKARAAALSASGAGAGWATPEKAGPVADPYALLPSMPHIPDQTKPVATWFKTKDPPVELPRGCRSADDALPEDVKRTATEHGLTSVWHWPQDSGLEPADIYLRHCLLANEKAGGEAARSFLHDTYLADRTTTLAAYLASPAGERVRACRPPEDLAKRFGG